MELFCKILLIIFAKMLYHRFLIGFLNTSLGNTVQKTSERHLKDISSVIQNILFLYSYHVAIFSFVEQIKNKKNMYMYNMYIFLNKKDIHIIHIHICQSVT